MQSALLNEAATLFRRRYYANGSHAGFILYVTDPAQHEEDIEAMRDQLIKSKGVGNFKNLFYYAPNGKADGIKLIPISEVAAKDEFVNIKASSRDDVLAAHRVPPQLMGMMPNNVGGFGDVEKGAKVFARNEIRPLQSRIKDELNAWAGAPVCDFRPYSLDDDEQVPSTRLPVGFPQNQRKSLIFQESRPAPRAPRTNAAQLRRTLLKPASCRDGPFANGLGDSPQVGASGG